MAWFRNYYRCARCHSGWADEWSCMCDDDCPNCDARHMSPYDSEDLTEVIEMSDGEYIVMRSPDVAEDKPRYVELARFVTAEQAARFLEAGAAAG